ncbi:hypothetical protein BO94DRAFT_571971 [Aspergillus sclerotioniger CBS 115572]|uniref:Zn(2)-C6 fungal-type domain-containing protein n=1 Tax=Aspergillus sclerotioniger CBS 115572 TaxID=1450535 RepID=A0A317XBA0_9EURO|nr:hypothetical protein BO94DRAFT_571971 [Aspergillus sclerotioniger CBS 115572]PWY95391.1 hypothetical protein BO94DRAFT_571971 [Aspergillus sclerotioniger CBS 115572]
MPPKLGGIAKQRTSRRKIALACDACREKKIRCDGEKPVCGSCLRRSYGIAQCAYSMENSRTASQEEYIRALRSRIKELEDICLQAGVSAPDQREDASYQKDCRVNTARPSQRQRSSPQTATGDDQVRQTRPEIEQHAVEQASIMPRIGSSHQQQGANPFHEKVTNSGRATILRDGLNLNITRGRRDISEASSVSPHFDSPGHVTTMGQISTPGGALAVPTPVREYYGSSSTASLMRFARVSIPWQSSASSAGIGSAHYQFYESPNTQYRMNDFSLPPRSLADHLLDCFWEHIACIYPFFDQPTFEMAYDNLWKSKEEMNELPDIHIGLGGQFDSNPKSIVFHCALNAMFALGCHFSDIPLHEREATAHSFFLRSKRFVGLDLLEIHTVGVVQALLIVALYLQSSPYPSRCWNAIGLACRLAQGLGLHEANPSSMMPLETEVRRRTWHGCVMLDVFVSMTHGRPSMTSHLAPVPLPYSTGAVPPTMYFYMGTIKLYRILDKVLSDVYNMWRSRSSEGVKSTFWSEGSFDPLLELERQLQSFKAGLPSCLKWTTSERLDRPVESAILDRQRNILRSRYYYIRLLLYRPIFTQVCSDSSPVTNQQRNGPAWRDAESSLQSCIINKCAATCVTTAIDLVQLTYDTYLTPFTDAWWYNGFYASTCALVLIMASSVPSLSDTVNPAVIEETWKKSETVLTHMATFSQSARTSLRFLQAAFSQTAHGRPSSRPSPRDIPNPSRGSIPTHTAGAHSAADGPTSSVPPQTNTPGLDSSYWTDSDFGFGSLQDDLGLLSWIDVPDMWQWLSRPDM